LAEASLIDAENLFRQPGPLHILYIFCTVVKGGATAWSASQIAM
jgi:hypothetical protein